MCLGLPGLQLRHERVYDNSQRQVECLRFSAPTPGLGGFAELPDDWRVHASRGLALAGLGRRAEALREARWLQQSPIYREDHRHGALAAEHRARILAHVGEAAAALDEIEGLLTRPSWLSVHTLQLDPLWDPLRNDSRFQALLAKYQN
jgi:serine/threonine-protein kinase